MNRDLGKTLSQVFIYTGACIWFLYVFHHSLPGLDGKRLVETVGEFIAGSGIYDVLLIAWLWLAAYVIGTRFLARLGVRPDPGAERISFASAAGLALVSLIVLVLAALKVLYKPVVFALLVVPIALWRSDVWLLTLKLRQRPWRRTAAEPPPPWRMSHVLIVLYLTVVLGVVLISALGPEIEYDGLVYHLTAPKWFARTHGLRPIPDIPFTFFPKNIEMLFALAMRLHNHITAKLVHYLLGLLSIFAAYALATRLFSRTTGLLSAAVLVASPLFIWEMRTAHIDLGLTLYVFLSLYAIVIWTRTGERPWLWLATFLTAFSLGVKYHAIFGAMSLAALVFLLELIRRKKVDQAVLPALKFVLFSAAGLIPWGIVNLYYTGNPVFPFLNNLFQSPYWTASHTQLEVHELMGAGIRFTLANWWAPFTVFWQMIGPTDRFHGNVGPFFMLLLPLLVLRRPINQEVKLVLLFSLFYSVIWLFTGQVARFYLPALPGLAVAGAYAAMNLLEGGKGLTSRVLSRATATLLAVLFVCNSPFFEAYGANSRYGAQIIQTLPLKCLAGIESREQYLARYARNYSVIQYLNRLPGRKKVFFCWNDTEPSAFFVEGESAYIYSAFSPQLSSNDPEQIWHILRRNAITHLIVGQHNQGAYLLTSPERDFVRRYLRKIYQKNATILYELAPEPLIQDEICHDLLGHIDRAQINMPNEPQDRTNDYYRVTMGIGDDRRYALVTFPPAEVAFSLTLCERSVLKFAVGQVFPECAGKGTFQVWIVPQNGEGRMLYVRELDAQRNPSDVGWFEHEVELGDYANRTVELIFKTVSAGGGCNWYLWGDPVIIKKSKPAL